MCPKLARGCALPGSLEETHRRETKCGGKPLGGSLDHCANGVWLSAFVKSWVYTSRASTMLKGVHELVVVEGSPRGR